MGGLWIKDKIDLERGLRLGTVDLIILGSSWLVSGIIVPARRSLHERHAFVISNLHPLPLWLGSINISRWDHLFSLSLDSDRLWRWRRIRSGSWFASWINLWSSFPNCSWILITFLPLLFSELHVRLLVSIKLLLYRLSVPGWVEALEVETHLLLKESF